RHRPCRTHAGAWNGLEKVCAALGGRGEGASSRRQASRQISLGPGARAVERAARRGLIADSVAFRQPAPEKRHHATCSKPSAMSNSPLPTTQEATALPWKL